MSRATIVMVFSHIVIGLLWNGLGGDVLAALESTPARGVVVEEVGEGGTLAKAGL